jgi:DNA-directed RNA polymerase subunit beta'
MNIEDISAIRIKLLDPDKILSKAKGEVKYSKTLESSGRPVLGGLFCPRIFGTMEPGTCICGIFYKGYREKQITCEKCGYEVISENRKKGRFGYVELRHPVVHIWFRRIIATLLAIPPKKLKNVINCLAFVVLKPGETSYKDGEIISLREYLEAKGKRNFVADTGGTVIYGLLKELDIKDLVDRLRQKAPSRRINKRLQIARDFMKSGINPEWMVLSVLPVLPAKLRPVIIMDDGTIASSDLNELYARVINRNNRLKELEHMGSPEILKLIERRLLQGSVDSLLQNSRDHTAMNRTRKRVLKSLSDFIEKKEGRLRRNLLGKRVDYSGRSVIVAGPTLKLNQCGLPIVMALDMLRPFIYGNLLHKGFAISLRHASLLVDLRRPEAIDALEEELRERVVILNRAPSLHRMSLQAFEPVLVAGKAIRLHPLVCTAFNADFDGDQMGVHIPITLEAQIETRILMLSVNNLLSPANGKLIMTPTQDIVLGIYYLTKNRNKRKGEGMIFSDKEDALCAHYAGVVELHANVIVRMNGQRIATTPGRLIFSEIFPRQIRFEVLNKTIRKKDLARLVEMCYDKAGQRNTVMLLDKIKDIGFKYATQSGISFCSSDIIIPKERSEIIERTEREVNDINEKYGIGEITDAEKRNKIIDLWGKTAEEISERMMDHFGVEDDTGMTEEQKCDAKEFNSMYMMADSGARGTGGQMSQLGGMRGLMARPTGEIMEIPIKSNLKEGLTYHEYLLAAHGARKGRADGALKTANAGHFTRRLVDAAHDLIINKLDCGTMKSITMTELIDNDEVVITLEERIFGRYAGEDVIDSSTGKVIVRRNEIIDKNIAGQIAKAKIKDIQVRSPFSCQCSKGICVKCYGYYLTTRMPVTIGEAVGIMAAQSIGEPGTQLTLRTFHSGGSASTVSAKNPIEAKIAGHIKFNGIKTVRNKNGKLVAINRSGRLSVITGDSKEIDCGALPYGSVILVEENRVVESGVKIAQWDPYNLPIISTTEGDAEFIDIIEGSTMKQEVDQDSGVIRRVITAIKNEMIPKIKVGRKEYMLPIGAIIVASEHSKVNVGDLIAKTPKQAKKTSDITGGLPKVLQILESRSLENPAIVAEISGELRINPPKGKFMIVDIVGKNGDEANYVIPMERQINFYDGDSIKAGDVIADGDISVNDTLNIFGSEKAAVQIVNEVQKVYLSQGVSINDKHFEVIARRMLGFVRVVDSGDTDLVADDVLPRQAFFEINEKTERRKATAKPILLGLAKAAMNSESWLSAASFERTSSVLANAAIQERVDFLSGVKENVIIGKRIPVGTGHPYYQETRIVKEERAVSDKEKKNDDNIIF